MASARSSTRCSSAGRRFPGDDAVSVIAQHLNSQPPRAFELEPRPFRRALDELILRLLAKSPADRPASAEEVTRLLKKMSSTLEPAGSQACGEDS